MKMKSITAFLTYLLLLSTLTVPAIACPDPDCGACCHWVSTGPGPSDGYCDLDIGADCGDCSGCGPCYSCANCYCNWDCSASPGGGPQCCSGGSCVDNCPNGQCCDAGDCVSSCPSGKCCSNGWCVDTCPGCQTCQDDVCEDDNSECSGGSVCCDGTCCSAGQSCCDYLTCYDPSTQKCCNDGIGTVCNIDEPCCDDGTCGLCCWTLEEHPDGTGDCGCSEATGHCGTSIQAWSISTCKRSASGAKSCSVTYRQVGSEYGCDESIDWVNVFLCYMGQAGECTAICSAGLATCLVSLLESGGAGCEDSAAQCYDCILDYIEGEPDDCGCLVVICEIGDVIAPIMNDAGTLSGGTCP